MRKALGLAHALSLLRQSFVVYAQFLLGIRPLVNLNYSFRWHRISKMSGYMSDNGDDELSSLPFSSIMDLTRVSKSDLE